MPRKVPGRKSITTIFTEEEYDNIRILAAKKDTSMNEIVREYVINGLNGTLSQQNLDILVPVIRDQLKSILDPAVSRLSSLSAKACVQSGAAAYLSAEALHSFVSPERSQDFFEAYESARKKAVLYMKGNADLE